MPYPGDQHRDPGASRNDVSVDSQCRQIYSASEARTTQDRLNQRLGPEFISQRAGPGGRKLGYMTGEKAINLANSVFGFNGWSSQIQNVVVDFVSCLFQTYNRNNPLTAFLGGGSSRKNERRNLCDCAHHFEGRYIP